MDHNYFYYVQYVYYFQRILDSTPDVAPVTELYSDREYHQGEAIIIREVEFTVVKVTSIVDESVPSLPTARNFTLILAPSGAD